MVKMKIRLKTGALKNKDGNIQYYFWGRTGTGCVLLKSKEKCIVLIVSASASFKSTVDPWQNL
jgi:hypothetical protein